LDITDSGVLRAVKVRQGFGDAGISCPWMGEWFFDSVYVRYTFEAVIRLPKPGAYTVLSYDVAGTLRPDRDPRSALIAARKMHK